MTIHNWDLRFMALADHTARWSKDPSTKVGAVIVDNIRRVVSQGFNGFPRGVNDAQHRYQDKATKYKFVVHAEANAILHSQGNTLHATLYSTKYPCSECTKLLIQSGIRILVTRPKGTNAPWAGDAEFSEVMLDEAGVTVRIIP